MKVKGTMRGRSGCDEHNVSKKKTLYCVMPLTIGISFLIVVLHVVVFAWLTIFINVIIFFVNKPCNLTAETVSVIPLHKEPEV